MCKCLQMATITATIRFGVRRAWVAGPRGHVWSRGPREKTLVNLCRVLFFFCALGCATIAQGGPLGTQAIGAYGDSMTMQYSFWLPLAPQFNYNVYNNGTQFNWVDQLVKAGY